MVCQTVAGFKVLISLFSSPIIGFIVGLIIIKIVLLLSWKASLRINGFFKRSQILTGITLALSHGANDAQKTMGVITPALVTSGYLKVFAVPRWVIYSLRLTQRTQRLGLCVL